MCTGKHIYMIFGSSCRKNFLPLTSTFSSTITCPSVLPFLNISLFFSHSSKDLMLICFWSAPAVLDLIFKFSCIKSTSETRLWCKDYSLTLWNSKERYFLSLQKPCCIQVTRTHCYLNITQLWVYCQVHKSSSMHRCTSSAFILQLVLQAQGQKFTLEFILSYSVYTFGLLPSWCFIVPSRIFPIS